jgi:predicted P-loop ATPase/GTPase
MKSQLKRPLRRTDGTPAMMFCCHGMIYTVTDKVLGVITDSADEILDRLRRIDGVKVVEIHGGLTNLTVPTLRLPEVTRVLVPLDSAWAPQTLAAAARGRIW